MNKIKVLNSFTNLRLYCECEDFKGWDPYDGLNSRVFQVLPFLKKSALCRLVVIQGFKRCPLNLRRLASVPKGHNAKGIALFLSGYCNLFYAIEKGFDVGVSKEHCLGKINYLAELLISMQSKGYSGACWGYNFDWQSKAFFLPKDTPTVVATSFVVEALLSAYDISKVAEYKETAISSAKFILLDLNRIPKDLGFMFSYSPLDNRAVYNASLLGSKTLSLIYKYTQEEDLKRYALASVQAVCAIQNSDGSFPHSDQIGNKWRDNFHTGFKLESLAYYQQFCNDKTFNINIKRGFEYWIKNYFVPNSGIAKYYDNSSENDLIDLHCIAQAIPTIYKLNQGVCCRKLVYDCIEWAIKNMQSKKGFFYYTKKRNHINKIDYMRWPNAWMFYGMSYWIVDGGFYEEN